MGPPPADGRADAEQFPWPFSTTSEIGREFSRASCLFLNAWDSGNLKEQEEARRETFFFLI